MRAEREHFPGVRVRGPRLGVQVIAIVPDNNKPKIPNGSEHGGPGARRDPDRAAEHGEPAAVAFGRTEIGCQADVLAGAEDAGKRGVNPGQVPGVGDDDQGTAPGRRGRRDRAGDLIRPVRAWQR